MEFSAPSFLFVFLPLLVGIYYLMPSRKAKNIAIMAASLVFYAFGSLADVPLLLASALLHYAAGLLLQKKNGRKAVVAAVLVLDLGALFFYKYFDFFMQSLPFVQVRPLGLHLPLGISFFTFNAISYLIDVYRDSTQTAKNFWQFLQYLSFFPQIVSGPLMKFRDAKEQIENRVCSAEQCVQGLHRFARGMAKKLLIAGGVGTITDAVFALELSTLDVRTAWLGAICYAVQIFFDFSGYTDMAIGLGAMFGFQLPENFNSPYLADSVTDFWRRWHISLSSWFRDYLYIPLGGNRKGKARTMLNKWIVFLMTGLWHGANWTFIVWGLWHGFFMSLETATGLNKSKKCPFKHIYTLLVVVFGFVLFRAGTLTQGFSIIRAMLTGITLQEASTVLLRTNISRYAIAMLLVGILAILPVFSRVEEKISRNVWADTAKMIWTVILLVICVMQAASGSFVPFIYAQF